MVPLVFTSLECHFKNGKNYLFCQNLSQVCVGCIYSWLKMLLFLNYNIYWEQYVLKKIHRAGCLWSALFKINVL